MIIWLVSFMRNSFAIAVQCFPYSVDVPAPVNTKLLKIVKWHVCWVIAEILSTFLWDTCVPIT